MDDRQQTQHESGGKAHERGKRLSSNDHSTSAHDDAHHKTHDRVPDLVEFREKGRCSLQSKDSQSSAACLRMPVACSFVTYGVARPLLVGSLSPRCLYSRCSWFAEFTNVSNPGSTTQMQQQQPVVPTTAEADSIG